MLRDAMYAATCKISSIIIIKTKANFMMFYSILLNYLKLHAAQIPILYDVLSSFISSIHTSQILNYRADSFLVIRGPSIKYKCAVHIFRSEAFYTCMFCTFLI